MLIKSLFGVQDDINLFHPEKSLKGERKLPDFRPQAA